MAFRSSHRRCCVRRASRGSGFGLDRTRLANKPCRAPDPRSALSDLGDGLPPMALEVGSPLLEGEGVALAEVLLVAELEAVVVHRADGGGRNLDRSADHVCDATSSSDRSVRRTPGLYIGAGPSAGGRSVASDPCKPSRPDRRRHPGPHFWSHEPPDPTSSWRRRSDFRRPGRRRERQRHDQTRVGDEAEAMTERRRVPLRPDR